MATYADTYSRMVAWLKFALPLVALAILSTLFLLARTLDPERAIPYADVDVDQMVREERVTAPNYSGVTRDGSAISILADVARPDQQDPQRMTASSVVGRIDMPNGMVTDIEAPRARIDTAGGLARLEGGVTIVTSTGYRMTTEALDAALDETDIASDGAVKADGPPGRLTAGSMHLTREEGRGYLLVFNGGVRLVYDPGSIRE